MEKLTVDILEKEYIQTKNKLDELQSKLADIKALLIEAYEDDTSINDNGPLTIYYMPPKKVVSWKLVAQTLEPSQSLIDEYTKMSKPAYGIKLKNSEPGMPHDRSTKKKA